MTTHNPANAIKARKRAHGSTIQGFFEWTVPPTQGQADAATALIRRRIPASDPAIDQVLSMLFDEPTPLVDTPGYLDAIERRKVRRRNRRHLKGEAA